MRSVAILIACACGGSKAPVPEPPRSVDAAPSPLAVIVDAAPPDAAPVEPPAVEKPDENLTTVKEYTYEPAARLPEVAAKAAFKPLGKPRVVRFAINVWPGWMPLVWANQGLAPGKAWKDPRGGAFQLQLVLVDDASAMVQQFAAGELHVGWGSVDMLPLVVQRLEADPRTLPRVYQLVDWSNGGDGIVVRGNIRQIADLRGKTIVLAQNSPSHYFLLDTLLDAGLQPSDVKLKFTRDAFQAAAAFNQSRDIDAVVSWAPDTLALAKVPNSRLLISTAIANKLIADVWFARADFAKANPGIVEALVRGQLDAVADLASPKNHAAAEALVDKAFALPAGTAARMTADVYLANHADNREFLLDRNSPTGFRPTYENAASLYRAIRMIDEPLRFDQLVDFSVIKKLGAEPKYARQASAHVTKFTPVARIDLDRAVLTKTVTINFYPNSSDLSKQVADASGKQVAYDPDVDRTVADIAKLAGKYGAARIHIGGFTDSSMKGVADEALVKELSAKRAAAVRDALVARYKLDPAKLVSEGFGWDRPADPADPDNHAKNRRVEIRVVPDAAP